MKLVRSGGPAAVALLAGGVVLTACSTSGPAPQAVARSYLAAWASRDWSGMRALATSPPADFAAVNSAELTDLGVRQASYAAGRLTVTGSSAHESVIQRLEIPGVGTIPVRTTLRLAQVSGNWRVAWTPATSHRACVPATSCRSS